MSPCPIWEAIIELTTSGKSVPIDTSTKPIINGEAPNAEAILTECSTAVSLEKVNKITPATKINTGTKIGTTDANKKLNPYYILYNGKNVIKILAFTALSLVNQVFVATKEQHV
jgi:hypothetical protein